MSDEDPDVSSRIVREVHDEPHIAGRRITVLFVKEQVEDRGLHPEEVAERQELDLVDVYHALAYYHEHPEEMERVERERERIVEAHRDRATTPDDRRE